MLACGYCIILNIFIMYTCMYFVTLYIICTVPSSLVLNDSGDVANFSCVSANSRGLPG